jgi:hypothetical protein
MPVLSTTDESAALGREQKEHAHVYEGGWFIGCSVARCACAELLSTRCTPFNVKLSFAFRFLQPEWFNPDLDRKVLAFGSVAKEIGGHRALEAAEMRSYEPRANLATVSSSDADVHNRGGFRLDDFAQVNS